MSEHIVCPGCGKIVTEILQSSMEKPFTAYDPIEGLRLWGPYSAPKGKVCRWVENGKWRVHFWDRIVEQK